MKKIRSTLFVVFFILNILYLPELQADDNAPDKNIPVYYYGIMPIQKGQPIDEIRAIYKPILIWLGTQVGCRFVLVRGETYEEMINMIVEGKVHLATLGSVPYVTVKEKNPEIKLLASELYWDAQNEKPDDSYSGYILALKTRTDIKTFKDLKDKKYAFVDRNSTLGYMYPAFLVRSRGLVPEDFFSKIFFMGSHPRVTDAIAAGSVDAGGATYDFNFKMAVEKHGDVFKVIVESPRMPSQAIVAHPSLPDDICIKIQEVLPTIDPSLTKDFDRYGYIIHPDSFYDFIRLMLEQNEKTKGD